MFLGNKFVAGHERPGQKIINVRGRGVTEGSQLRNPSRVVVLPRYLIATTIAVSIIITVLCSTVVVASLAAWTMLH
jgi:hypothetical protein